jgi:hypothetical protein
MGWFEKFKLRLQIISIVFSIGCPVVLTLMALGSKQELASYQWPATDGTVVTLVPKSWQNDEGRTKYYGRVLYKYEVEGKSYTSDLTGFFPGWKRDDEATALADVSQYRRGDKVTVFYDPKHPGVGVIEKGIPPLTQKLYMIVCGVFIVSSTGAVFTVRSWLRAWRSRKGGPTVEARV